MSNDFPPYELTNPSAAHEVQEAAPPSDAPVSVYSGLVFATTGQMACYELNAPLDQVALTPAVALRIAAVLRETLQYGDLRERDHAVQVWSASEAAAMPHGRVLVSESCIQFGIEPLGAGALVTVQWAYVPGLILALENAANWLISQR
ncbi:hypothetical protein Poly30_17290 [Planctomycetes bacterium Poly30]|uniref:Uncharacterized protein n=1 Tax=Saltatorellus ferox TaxID=2528018 RepID=A0A518EQ58_9BACT|nr:hypothetical protein Poly30_17290 [Planctomycetes bacterium Poly30]